VLKALEVVWMLVVLVLVGRLEGLEGRMGRERRGVVKIIWIYEVLRIIFEVHYALLSFRVSW
jgi:hypothetical protein